MTTEKTALAQNRAALNPAARQAALWLVMPGLLRLLTR